MEKQRKPKAAPQECLLYQVMEKHADSRYPRGRLFSRNVDANRRPKKPKMGRRSLNAEKHGPQANDTRFAGRGLDNKSGNEAGGSNTQKLKPH